MQIKDAELNFDVFDVDKDNTPPDLLELLEGTIPLEEIDERQENGFQRPSASFDTAETESTDLWYEEDEAIYNLDHPRDRSEQRRLIRARINEVDRIEQMILVGAAIRMAFHNRLNRSEEDAVEMKN